MIDPVLQTCIFAIAIHFAGAAIALYLWSENRNERFLLFWALAWTAGLVRWLIHYPALSNDLSWLQAAEVHLISLTMFFMVLGSYDLLPSKPWRQRIVVVTTGLILLAYGAATNAFALAFEAGYVLFAGVLAFSGVCMAIAYRSSRLPGYLFGAGTCAYQLLVVAFMLRAHGDAMANSIVPPLYNIPLILSIVVITYQRHRRQLIEAEQDLRASAEETRQLYTRLGTVEEDERRMLHAELHDQVGANLSALRLALDVATSMISRNDPVSAERHLNDAREVAAETIGMARNLMAELRPPALDDFGLMAALRSFAELQSSRLSLPIQVIGNELQPRPDPLIESSLFRIAHEGVMNAARHASASRVTIDIAARDGRLVLNVVDDGVGFDVMAPGTRPDHWGLKSMRERARAVGGTLTVESARGSGTRITADVPRHAT